MTKPYDVDVLLAQARQAMNRAYAPYSHFKVGAALLTADGQIIYGCNVENASYGLTMCAERSAIGAAVGLGLQKFKAVAIVASGAAPCTPCGACRQVLAEFNPGMQVILERGDGSVWDLALSELLPHQFVLEVDQQQPEKSAQASA